MHPCRYSACRPLICPYQIIKTILFWKIDQGNEGISDGGVANLLWSPYRNPKIGNGSWPLWRTIGTANIYQFQIERSVMSSINITSNPESDILRLLSNDLSLLRTEINSAIKRHGIWTIAIFLPLTHEFNIFHLNL
ncbi:hypothetical protein AFLA_000840 [Aspergillus flavus NRRL3357]|nr:hypothetical protein AFLA_000840 [Aspergillus flavus NRRL3357]